MFFGWGGYNLREVNGRMCTVHELAILSEHMHKKFQINRTKIKGGCHSVRKVITNNSKSELPLSQKIFWTFLAQADNTQIYRNYNLFCA